MPPANILGILLSLISAATWGGGDFFGGLSTRKHNQYAVLVVSAAAGILVLIICTLIWPEPFPAWPMALWAVMAGLCGVVGLGTLYKALSLGHSATVAPTAAVIGAAIPVMYGIIITGFPDVLKLIGFCLAFIGIWFVSRISGETGKVTSTSLILAILAGIGFGGFYIFITLAGPKSTFTPLIISRSTFFIASTFLMISQHGKLGKATWSPTVWMAGLFDASGNALYMLAKQFTRIDVAVVLSSLYPAITVVLSRIFLKEKISRFQWFGVGLCFTAVVLITL
jgi:drug/metabolite transporter (DMT)-like permease